MTMNFPPPESIQRRAWIRDRRTYQLLYEKSLHDPAAFWSELAAPFRWFKKWDRVLSYDWGKELFIRWFEGAKTNLSVNCLDRHLQTQPDKTAVIFEDNDGKVTKAEATTATDKLLVRMDTNKDGMISIDDLTRIARFAEVPADTRDWLAKRMNRQRYRRYRAQYQTRGSA